MKYSLYFVKLKIFCIKVIDVLSGYKTFIFGLTLNYKAARQAGCLTTIKDIFI